eukprot:gene6235-6472_t
MAAGDLSLQLTVPGFTDVLVAKVSDSQLVPAFAEALVTHVKQSMLLQHVVEGLAERCGQQGFKINLRVVPGSWQEGSEAVLIGSWGL